MLRLNSEITIGNLKFTYVNNCEIYSSWEKFTDTATIQLPNNLRLKNIQIKDIIKINDPVTIKLGYFPNLTTRFTGYVSKLVNDSPLKVMCEDESYKLKQQFLESYSEKRVSLETLIKDNYTGNYNVSDADLAGFSIQKGATMIDLLQKLRSVYKLYSWFRDGVLYVGLPYLGNGITKNFHFQKNIISGTNLEVTDETDLRTIAYGVSHQTDGTKIELYTYYENGQIKTSETNPTGYLNTLSIPDLTKAKLTKLLERWLPNIYYTGYKGEFITFGEPAMKHGDVAQIKDLKYPEKDGKYLIKSVRLGFGQDGYRQRIELDSRINE